MTHAAILENVRVWIIAMWKSVALGLLAWVWISGLKPGSPEAAVIKARDVTTTTIKTTFNQFMIWANDLNP